MIERVRDAVVQHLRHLRHRLGAEIAADDVAAERQRQAAGALEPPLAEVDDLVQALGRVGQLSLVNQQPGIDATVLDRVLDLVERDDLEVE